MRWRALRCLALAVALCSACDSDTSDHASVRGEPAAAPPLRIVALSAEIAEILVGLGVAPQVVGADTASRRLPGLAFAADLGELCQIRAPAVRALAPDLALALADPCGSSLAHQLEPHGAEVLLFDPRGLDDAVAVWQRLGARLGRELRARAEVARLVREISRIATARDGKRRLRVVWLLERVPLVAVGAAGVLHEMLELAGAENALHAPPSERLEVSVAEIIAAAPDLVLDGSGAAIAGEGLALPDSLTVVPVAPDLSRMPVLDVLRRMARLHAVLYPEASGDGDDVSREERRRNFILFGYEKYIVRADAVEFLPQATSPSRSDSASLPASRRP